ncbi:MAG: hypothetical protein Tsb0020_03100 [Haliangiales bacterium]
MKLSESIPEIHRRYRGLTDGVLANYIPELARVDPALFAVSAVTTDGRVFSAGDADSWFTVQSTAKAFALAAAFDHVAADEISARVGFEPTGEDFGSISKLDRMQRPMNPMVNSGALSICSMLKARFGSDCEEKIFGLLGVAAGAPMEIDDAVFASEMATTDGNRAIVYLLSKFKVLAADPIETLDFYVKLCSLRATATTLATMGATLANRGVNPMTGKASFGPERIRDVLSVMLTCGMYNYAGQWVFDVGVPAKSGVSGAVLMIVPGVAGIVVYSPPLDKNGTSVRGISVARELSSRHSFHLLDVNCPHTPDDL